MTPSVRVAVVFDCMVYLQAASRSAGPAASLFTKFVEPGHVTLLLSDGILCELRDVLSRPRIRAKNPSITDDSVESFLRRVNQIAQRVDDIPSCYLLPRDPDDEPYLNLALCSGADYLVTWDNDMLDLMRNQEFRVRCPRLTILTPVALINLLAPPPGT